MTSILKVDDIEYSKITYTKPEKKGNIYYSSIGYETSKSTMPLYIQTPRMKCMSIGSDILEKKNATILTEIMNNDYSIYDCLLKIDEQNINYTFQKSKEWFQKELPMEIIEDMYKTDIKASKEDETQTLRFKVPIIRNKMECTIYDQSKNYLTIESIQPETEVMFILHIKGLRFLKQHYYCEYYISQIKVCTSNPQFSILTNYMIDDEEDDISIIENEVIDEEVIETPYQRNQRKQKILDEINLKKNVRHRIDQEISELQKQVNEI